MDKIENHQLVEAVLLWTGWGREMKPRRDDSVLIERFGPECAARLLPAIKSLENNFYSSDAKYSAANLQEMESISIQQFKEKHPELPEEVAKAFAWCYTYDFK